MDFRMILCVDKEPDGGGGSHPFHVQSASQQRTGPSHLLLQSEQEPGRKYWNKLHMVVAALCHSRRCVTLLVPVPPVPIPASRF